MRLEGEVVPGQGIAKGFLEENDFYAKAIGTPLHKGTINLWVLGHYPGCAQSIYPQKVRAAGKLFYAPCKLDKHDAFLLATWSYGLAAKFTELEPRQRIALPNDTLFELVSACEIPGVAYGVPLVVEYDPNHVLSGAV